jgi:aminoglycoside phosphotransferase (APT) family kinase protein
MLSEFETARLVEAQFPRLAPVAATYLGEGCDSVAFVINGRHVFRFPKKEDVEEQLLREVQVLRHLAPRLNVAIPAYDHVGQPSPPFPRHFGGYPLIRGVPAIHVDLPAEAMRTVAATLGTALSGLHTWDVATARAHGVPSSDVDTVIDEVGAEALADFELVARQAPDAPLDRWLQALHTRPPATCSTTVVVAHADLSAEHVLYDTSDGVVTGIIDWSEIAISDAAMDIAGLYHWGGQPFVDAVLGQYTGPRPDDALLERAKYLAACRGVADVRFGLERDRAEYVRGGIRALHGIG